MIALALVMTGGWRDLVNFWKNGTIQAIVFPPPKRTYDASNEENLKALRTALMLFHDSEDKFPDAKGWMDAIEPRITASDMAPGESQKKLIRPDLSGKTGSFGYALNLKAAGKYKDDVGDPKAILVYESKQTARNAAGDPATDRDGMAITVDGTLLR